MSCLWKQGRERGFILVTLKSVANAAAEVIEIERNYIKYREAISESIQLKFKLI
jgi:hypothetical protein